MFQCLARRGKDRPDIGKQCLVSRAVAEILRDDGCNLFRFLFDGLAQLSDVFFALGEVRRPGSEKSLALNGEDIGGLRLGLDVNGFDHAHGGTHLNYYSLRDRGLLHPQKGPRWQRASPPKRIARPPQRMRFSFRFRIDVPPAERRLDSPVSGWAPCEIRSGQLSMKAHAERTKHRLSTWFALVPEHRALNRTRAFRSSFCMHPADVGICLSTYPLRFRPPS